MKTLLEHASEMLFQKYALKMKGSSFIFPKQR